MDRARRLIRPYLEKEGVIGIYVVGSSTRPFRDELSDYDIEVIMDDAVYERTPMEERHTFTLREGEPKAVDYEFYLIPWKDFVAMKTSTHDLFHYAYQHAVILHDPEERIAPVVRKLAELPEKLRLERMTVHFLEFLFGLGRARKTAQRGDRWINLALLRDGTLRPLVKLIFLARHSWPATAHWTEQEFEQTDVPNTLLSAVEAWLSNSLSEQARTLAGAVVDFLDDCGESFHHDRDGIEQWLFLTTEGKDAFERWGTR